MQCRDPIQNQLQRKNINVDKKRGKGKQIKGRSLDVNAVHINNGSSVLRSIDGILSQNISLQGANNPLPHLPLDTVVDSVQDGIHGHAGLVGRLSALLVDTSLDEDAVPLVIGLLVDSVGAADITLRSVTDKVHGGWGSLETVLILAPLAHQARSELKGRDLRLAEGVGVQDALAAGEVLEGDLEHAAESTHAEADVLVGSRPDDVVVGEVECGTLVEGLAPGSELTTLRHGDVEHDLDITSPVAGIRKDEDSVDGNIVEVSLTRVGMLLGSELAEGSSGRVVLDNIAGSDDVLEAVALSDVSALLALAANDENGAVRLSHLAHGSVAADELAGFDVALELAGEVTAALLFGLAAAVCEEDVRTVVE